MRAGEEAKKYRGKVFGLAKAVSYGFERKI